MIVYNILEYSKTVQNYTINNVINLFLLCTKLKKNCYRTSYSHFAKKLQRRKWLNKRNSTEIFILIFEVILKFLNHKTNNKQTKNKNNLKRVLNKLEFVGLLEDLKINKK